MDPFSQAAGGFRARTAAFWKVHPTAILRAVAADGQREDLLAAARWEEAQVDCTRPLCIVEASFDSVEPYFAAASRQVLEVYQSLREAGNEVGTPLAEVKEAESSLPAVALAKTGHEVALALSRGVPWIKGLTIVLAPVRVADAKVWAEQMGMLQKAVNAFECAKPDGTAGATRTPANAFGRWMVVDAPRAPLREVLGEGVEFCVDDGAMLNFWKGALERQASTQAAAQSAAAANHGSSVAQHVAAATEHLQARRPTQAVDSFRHAEALCTSTGKTLEAIGLRMAIAGVQLGMPVPAEAALNYGIAANAATEIEAWSLAAQAKLGEGGAELVQKRYKQAASVYSQAAALADKAGVTALQMEATRMAGVCQSLAGDKQETMAETLR